MTIEKIEIKGVVKRMRAVDISSPEHFDIALQVLLEMLAKQIPPENPDKPLTRFDLLMELSKFGNSLFNRLALLYTVAIIAFTAIIIGLLTVFKLL